MAKKLLTLSREGANASAVISDGNQRVRWETLSREEQVELLNIMAHFYVLFYNHLKPE